MALATEAADARLEAWLKEEQRGFLLRLGRGVVHFVRRKPLGTFGGVLVLIPLLVAIFGPGITLFGTEITPRLTPYHYNEYELGEDQLVGISSEHWMGTDHLGRDLFSRMAQGARLSFYIGWSILVISSVISTTLTIISAYYIRTVDLILQRVIELIGFLPDLILLIAVFSIFKATPTTLIITLSLLIGFTSSRVLRSVVIGLRAMPYIESAKAIGASDVRVIVAHILPNLWYLIIVGATQAMAGFLLIESGLAILGFGISVDYPTFGNLLNASRQYLRVAPHLAFFPGLVLFMILLGSRLFGDALRDVLDPRLRGSR